MKICTKTLLATAVMATGLLQSNATVSEKTYDMSSGLILSYSGEPMLGKTVKFTPDASDAAKATLTLSSVFDLSENTDLPEALRQKVAGPGVIPGSPEVTLPVSLTESTNGEFSFSGNASTEYVTYKYSGSVSESTLKLDITDATLLNDKIVGSWDTASYLTNDWGDEVYSTPVHIVWTSDKSLKVMEGFEMPMESLLQLVMVMPIVNDTEIVRLLPQTFKQVSFLNDGNLTANIVSEGKDITSPKNMAQYVVRNDESLLLFLDPTAIAAFDAQVKKAPASRGLADLDINNILGNVFAQLVPMLSQGLPLGYTLEGDDLCIYLGDDVLLPLLKNNVVPLLKDTELVREISELLAQSSDETMAAMAPLLPGIAASLVEVIEGTTKIELGVNFNKNTGAAVKDIITDSSRVETARYNIHGQKVGTDYRGIVIIRYNDGSATKAIVR